MSVALAMLQIFNDYKGIITTIQVRRKLEELILDEIESDMAEARDRCNNDVMARV